MINYHEFYDLLFKYNMITPIWQYEIEIIKKELKDDYKEEYLILFLIYFSLICKGNACMSLNQELLNNKWEKELNSSYILFSEKIDKEILEKDFQELIAASKNAYNKLNELSQIKLIKDLRYFIIDQNYLYLRKYENARKGIIKSIDRLFHTTFNNKPLFSVDQIVKDPSQDKPKFTLSERQNQVVQEGLNNNLIVTGGPGTGKTTSILFIILGILANNIDYNIYLAAASGKASSRMKEAIINNLNIVDSNKFENFSNMEVLNKVRGIISDDDNIVEEFTIHRLLGVSNEGFKYNKNNQFPENSIFIIDEASMIDICLFNSLLEAIPNGARIFILGDKDQLPSVEVGAVFAELIEKEDIKVIKLDESKRFNESTDIFKLARKVNEGIELKDIEFLNPKDFKIETTNKTICPIYYYLNNGTSEKEDLEQMASIWANAYFKNVQNDATDIDLNLNRDLNLNCDLSEIFKYTENSKILCAENSGTRGVQNINNLLRKKIIDKTIGPNRSNHYPGEVMMINKNNRSLELYNGDTGILVSIKDDETIYLMVKKNINIVSHDGYKKDAIFKMGNYVFYPLRLISDDEIDLAYAITVHKSQGSDYDNILVISPIYAGHPLLNRQILYTAITRTKGNTYIYSNMEAINSAIKTRLIRDTNINNKY